MPKKKTHRISYREETQIVEDLRSRGYEARRQPGSGNRANDLQNDIVWFDSPQGRLEIESKYRETCMWNTMESWRGTADILVVRCDARKAGQNGEPMAFLPWKLLLDLIQPITEEWEPSEQIWEPGGGSYTTEKPPR